jgi:hypothetical protein
MPGATYQAQALSTTRHMLSLSDRELTTGVQTVQCGRTVTFRPTDGHGHITDVHAIAPNPLPASPAGWTCPDNSRFWPDMSIFTLL